MINTNTKRQIDINFALDFLDKIDEEIYPYFFSEFVRGHRPDEVAYSRLNIGSVSCDKDFLCFDYKVSLRQRHIIVKIPYDDFGNVAEELLTLKVLSETHDFIFDVFEVSPCQFNIYYSSHHQWSIACKISFPSEDEAYAYLAQVWEDLY